MKISNVSKGDIILFKEEPFLVVEKDFFKLGRGRGHLKAKLKNIRTGAVVKQTFNSEEQVETVELLNKKLQYLYSEAGRLYFMDPQTFEQIEMEEKFSLAAKKFIVEGGEVNAVYWRDKPISLKIPPKVSLKVIKAEHAVKGDTVSGATKEVILETGLRVKVPLFIKEGDQIIINTESEQYVGRESQT